MQIIGVLLLVFKLVVKRICAVHDQNILALEIEFLRRVVTNVLVKFFFRQRKDVILGQRFYFLKI